MSVASLAGISVAGLEPHEQLYASRPGGYPQCTVLDAQRNVPRQLATHMVPLAGLHPKLRPSSHGARLACLTSSHMLCAMQRS